MPNRRGGPVASPRRRRVLGALASALALPACSPTEQNVPAAVPYRPGQPLPWINWAANQVCYPRERPVPSTEAELAEVLRRARGVVRAVGAGHSFTAMVPTDDTLVSMDLFEGVVAHDADTQQAEVWAGTRLHALGPMLAQIDQALPNMPDIDYVSLGGAIANSAHATGVNFGSMSTGVTGLTLATADGRLVECSAARNPAVFQAARNSLGALGIATRVRLQNQAAFRLTETDRIERTEDVLDELPARLHQHRHFEFLPLPHSAFCVTVTTDLAGPADRDAGEDDPRAALTLRRLFELVNHIPGGAGLYDRILRLVFGDAASTVRTGPAHLVFPHLREVRFREMEYAIPAAAAGSCVREILATIRTRALPVCFPLEVRFVKGDDIWLSMFEGRDSCAISVHQYADTDPGPYFAQIEPIFWKYEGRPHWGKLHTLEARRLAPLYPRHWQDYRDVRQALDPGGKLLNAHLRSVLGVPA